MQPKASTFTKLPQRPMLWPMRKPALQIQGRAYLHLADLCHDDAAGHTSQNTAVDGKPSLADVQDLGKVALEGLPVKDHIVQPGADDAAEQPHHCHIDEAVAIHAHLPGIGEDIDPCQHKADADEQAVPVYIEPTDGKGHPVQFKFQPQAGE